MLCWLALGSRRPLRRIRSYHSIPVLFRQCRGERDLARHGGAACGYRAGLRRFLESHLCGRVATVRRSQFTLRNNGGCGSYSGVALASDAVNAFYKKLRDQFEPDKPLWVTETADAACGGNPWASTFLDTFRYFDEHASLAQQGVRGWLTIRSRRAIMDFSTRERLLLAPTTGRPSCGTS